MTSHNGTAEAANTGVPDEVTLTTHSGDLVVATAGAVISVRPSAAFDVNFATSAAAFRYLTTDS